MARKAKRVPARHSREASEGLDGGDLVHTPGASELLSEDHGRRLAVFRRPLHRPGREEAARRHAREVGRRHLRSGVQEGKGTPLKSEPRRRSAPAPRAHVGATFWNAISPVLT